MFVLKSLIYSKGFLNKESTFSGRVILFFPYCYKYDLLLLPIYYILNIIDVLAERFDGLLVEFCLLQERLEKYCYYKEKHSS